MQEEHGRLPAPHCEADADTLLALCKSLNEAAAEKAEIDEKVIRTLAYTAAGDLSPMAAFVGGVVAQEVSACACIGFCCRLFHHATCKGPS